MNGMENAEGHRKKKFWTAQDPYLCHHSYVRKKWKHFHFHIFITFWTILANKDSDGSIRLTMHVDNVKMPLYSYFTIIFCKIAKTFEHNYDDKINKHLKSTSFKMRTALKSHLWKQNVYSFTVSVLNSHQM